MSCHKPGTKKQFWVPMRNQTSDLWIPHSNALPLSLRDSTVSEVYYKIHMTHMRTARISFVDSIMFVNGVGEMVSFELGKEIEKDLFCLFTSVGQRKNSEFLWGIKPHTCSNRPRSA